MVCLFPPLFQSLNHNLNTKKLKEEEGKRKKEEKDLNSNQLHQNVSNNYLYIRALKAKKVFNLSKGAQWQNFQELNTQGSAKGSLNLMWIPKSSKTEDKNSSPFSTCSHKRFPLVKIACVPIGFTTICNPTCGTRHTPQV